MKKTTKLSTLILLLLSVTAISQVYISRYFKAEKNDGQENVKASIISQNNLNGTWYWASGNHTNTMELYLTQNGTTVSGKHCSSFMDGSKTDCVVENINSISLNMITQNVYEGTLSSEFSDAVVPIRITLNPTTETIEFKQLSQPSQEYYLPNNVTMTLAQD